jgi:hypothetical protein
MTPAGFKLAIAASQQLQILALDHSATEMSTYNIKLAKNLHLLPTSSALELDQ